MNTRCNCCGYVVLIPAVDLDDNGHCRFCRGHGTPDILTVLRAANILFDAVRHDGVNVVPDKVFDDTLPSSEVERMASTDTEHADPFYAVCPQCGINVRTVPGMIDDNRTVFVFDIHAAGVGAPTVCTGSGREFR